MLNIRLGRLMPATIAALATAFVVSSLAASAQAMVAPIGGSSSSSSAVPQARISLKAPAVINYGTTGTFVAVVQQVAAGIVRPLPDTDVQFQLYHDGRYSTVSTATSDASGKAQVDVTSISNGVYRALVTFNGKTTATSAASVLSSADVTWAGRPDDTISAGKAQTYSFRVGPWSGGLGSLQVASAAKPKVWTTVKGTPAVRGLGLMTYRVTLSKGTWLVRGISKSTKANTGGSTTVIKVVAK